MHRRTALGAMMLPLAMPALGGGVPRVSAAELSRRLGGYEKDPEQAAGDEAYWAEVREAFTVDRSIINLNNGGVSPSPRVVQEALWGHVQRANAWPPPVVLWRESPERREAVRRRLGELMGVGADTLAITRNATESLHICQHGIDLRPGDEVLTSDQDYPRMINAFRQRERREGIRLVQVDLPAFMDDPSEVVRRFEAGITERTRMMLCSHVVNLTGQIMPVKELCALGEQRVIPVVVDGAHAFAHLDFKISDLGCSYYGASLHKWLFAPHGTGLLYVQRERIEGLWPLFAENPGQQGDIRKFEEIGTHPAANFLAISEALDFHEAIGAQRKLARLIFLRDRWYERLMMFNTIGFSTNREHAAGIATFKPAFLDPVALADWLWSRHRVLVTPIVHERAGGIRVSPSVYTTVEEIDRFVELVLHAIRHGMD